MLAWICFFFSLKDVFWLTENNLFVYLYQIEVDILCHVKGSYTDLRVHQNIPFKSVFKQGSSGQDKSMLNAQRRKTSNLL